MTNKIESKIYEVELKAYYPPEDKEEINNIVKKIEKITGKQFVTEAIDDIFLDKSSELEQKGCQLRLRKQGRRCILTYKGKVDQSSGYKIREEREVNLDNCNEMLTIFYNLGFKQISRIKKVRMTLFFSGVQITVDSFEEIGSVMEVEGSKDDIEKAIKLLTLERARFGPMTYNDIVAKYKLRGSNIH